MHTPQLCILNTFVLSINLCCRPLKGLNAIEMRVEHVFA